MGLSVSRRRGSSAPSGSLFLRKAFLFEAHVFVTGDSRFRRRAMRLRETCGALRTDLVHHALIEPKMRVGHDSRADRLGVGFPDFGGDPAADGIHPLRRVHAGLGDLSARSFGKRGFLSRNMAGIDAEHLRKIILRKPLRVRPISCGHRCSMVSSSPSETSNLPTLVFSPAGGGVC